MLLIPDESRLFDRVWLRDRLAEFIQQFEMSL